jgi:hypothetical protein
VDVAGVDPLGDAIAVAVAGAPHSTLIAFLTSGCTTCAGFWSAFAQRDLHVPGGARLVVVTKGTDDESVSRLRSVAAPQITVVMSTEAWSDYRVPGSPYFIYVDGPTSRVIGEGAAGSWQQVAAFLEQSIADADLPAAPNERIDRINRDLLAAGITPGHSSLYPTPEREEAVDDA